MSDTPLKLTVNTDSTNPKFYLNEDGYQVIVESAYTAQVGRATIFVFVGSFLSGPNQGELAGYFTEQGAPISYFDTIGHHVGSPLREPESVADANSAT